MVPESSLFTSMIIAITNLITSLLPLTIQYHHFIVIKIRIIFEPPAALPLMISIGIIIKINDNSG